MNMQSRATPSTNDRPLEIQREDDLNLSRVRYESLFKYANDCMFTLDIEGRITSANPACKALIGTPEAGLIGSVITEYVAEAHRETLWRIIGELTDRASESVCFETEFLNTTGDVVAVELTYRTVIHSGIIVEIQCVARDLTDLRHLEESLVRVDELEALSKFSSGVTHHFTNMLTIILGHTEMAIEEADGDPLALRRIEPIHIAAKRAAIQIRQLLSFDRRHATGLDHSSERDYGQQTAVN